MALQDPSGPLESKERFNCVQDSFNVRPTNGVLVICTFHNQYATKQFAGTRTGR